MERDDAKKVLVDTVMDAIGRSLTDDGCYGTACSVCIVRGVDDLFSPELAEARAAMEEHTLPSRAEIDACRRLAIGAMYDQASEFCCSAEEEDEARDERRRVEAVFDAFRWAAPDEGEEGAGV